MAVITPRGMASVLENAVTAIEATISGKIPKSGGSEVGYQYVPNKKFFMLNPRILTKSKEKIKVWDSCFSFNVEFFIEIERFKNITVEYQDINENLKKEEFHDALSELVQHEIDHLYGVLAIDHLKDPYNIIMRSEWEKRFK